LKDLSVDDICALLVFLELNQYQDIFREKRMTGRKLSMLETIDDLKEENIEMSKLAFRTLFSEIETYKSNGIPRGLVDSWRGISVSESGSLSGTGSGSTKTSLLVSNFDGDSSLLYTNTFWNENYAGVSSIFLKVLRLFFMRF
jgi:hypothetical protein